MPCHIMSCDVVWFNVMLCMYKYYNDLWCWCSYTRILYTHKHCLYVFWTENISSSVQFKGQVPPLVKPWSNFFLSLRALKKGGTTEKFLEGPNATGYQSHEERWQSMTIVYTRLCAVCLWCLCKCKTCLSQPSLQAWSTLSIRWNLALRDE